MILREGLALTAAGLGVGVLLSISAGKAVASLLYRVPGFDPLVLGTAAVVLAVVSLVACYLPAARASRVDPMIALRQE
jgi:putative ABC transport system permease protein